VRTQPHAINNRGQIVGDYLDAEGKYHGFLLDGGVFITIDAPGGTSTKALDIDDSGRVVGISLNAANIITTNDVVRGFLRDAQGSFTPIDAPGTTQTSAFGINNARQIVGDYQDAQGRPRGFLLDKGVFTTIDATDPLRGTFVFDINDRGQLTGAFDLVTHGYVRDRRGNFTTVDHPDAVEITQPFGINNRGQIVGFYRDATGTKHAFLRDKDGFITIDIPGALGSEARRINDAGQIVGFYSTLNNRDLFPARGYLLDQGVVTTIDVPGALHTLAANIDNSGQIAGEYQDAAGMFHGFLRDQSGTFTTIDVPGATVTSIIGINDGGQMVGLYVDAAGMAHSFLREAGVAFTTLAAPGATLTIARDINNAGQIVGSFADEATIRGFVLSHGTFTTIDAAGNVIATHASCIDDRGRIVGIRD
jgi:probable HAF family extracellular repeat protein